MPARRADRLPGPRPGAGGAGAPLVVALLVAGLLSAVAAALWSWRGARAAQASLDARVAAIQPLPAGVRTVSCAEWRAERPLVLLALGQSNAANHGEPGAGTGRQAPVRLVHEGRCLWATDPLPGGTGDGGSIWARLPHRLAARLPPPWHDRPVVISVLAVDATPLRDWLRADSPLPALLQRQARQLTAAGLVPDLVLWQQGESDARANTSTDEVARQLQAFAGGLAQAGISAPWMLARSTRCRSAPHAGVRAAVDRLTGGDNLGRGFLPGPDTDALDGAAMRRDGCHFTAAGLDAAADQWAAALAAYFARR